MAGSSRSGDDQDRWSKFESEMERLKRQFRELDMSFWDDDKAFDFVFDENNCFESTNEFFADFNIKSNMNFSFSKKPAQPSYHPQPQKPKKEEKKQKTAPTPPPPPMSPNLDSRTSGKGYDPRIKDRVKNKEARNLLEEIEDCLYAEASGDTLQKVITMVGDFVAKGEEKEEKEFQSIATQASSESITDMSDKGTDTDDVSEISDFVVSDVESRTDTPEIVPDDKAKKKKKRSPFSPPKSPRFIKAITNGFKKSNTSASLESADETSYSSSDCEVQSRTQRLIPIQLRKGQNTQKIVISIKK